MSRSGFGSGLKFGKVFRIRAVRDGFLTVFAKDRRAAIEACLDGKGAWEANGQPRLESYGRDKDGTLIHYRD